MCIYMIWLQEDLSDARQDKCNGLCEISSCEDSDCHLGFNSVLSDNRIPAGTYVLADDPSNLPLFVALQTVEFNVKSKPNFKTCL
jgi:hypothetical protein